MRGHVHADRESTDHSATCSRATTARSSVYAALAEELRHAVLPLAGRAASRHAGDVRRAARRSRGAGPAGPCDRASGRHGQSPCRCTARRCSRSAGSKGGWRRWKPDQGVRRRCTRRYPPGGRRSPSSTRELGRDGRGAARVRDPGRGRLRDLPARWQLADRDGASLRRLLPPRRQGRAADPL